MICRAGAAGTAGLGAPLHACVRPSAHLPAQQAPHLRAQPGQHRSLPRAQRPCQRLRTRCLPHTSTRSCRFSALLCPALPCSALLCSAVLQSKDCRLRSELHSLLSMTARWWSAGGRQGQHAQTGEPEHAPQRQQSQQNIHTMLQVRRLLATESGPAAPSAAQLCSLRLQNRQFVMLCSAGPGFLPDCGITTVFGAQPVPYSSSAEQQLPPPFSLVPAGTAHILRQSGRWHFADNCRHLSHMPGAIC